MAITIDNLLGMRIGDNGHYVKKELVVKPMYFIVTNTKTGEFYFDGQDTEAMLRTRIANGNSFFLPDMIEVKEIGKATTWEELLEKHPEINDMMAEDSCLGLFKGSKSLDHTPAYMIDGRRYSSFEKYYKFNGHKYGKNPKHAVGNPKYLGSVKLAANKFLFETPPQYLLFQWYAVVDKIAYPSATALKQHLNMMVSPGFNGKKGKFTVVTDPKEMLEQAKQEYIGLKPYIRTAKNGYTIDQTNDSYLREKHLTRNDLNRLLDYGKLGDRFYATSYAGNVTIVKDRDNRLVFNFGAFHEYYVKDTIQLPNYHAYVPHVPKEDCVLYYLY